MPAAISITSKKECMFTTFINEFPYFLHFICPAVRQENLHFLFD